MNASRDFMSGATRSFAAALLLSIAGSLCAEESAAEAPKKMTAVKMVAIRAGRLVDVIGGKTLADQVIVVEGERIKGVGSAANTPIPAGAEVIDLMRSTVLPGLIDVHTHLTGDPAQHGYKALGISNIRAALYGARAARQTLQAGFTSVRNVGADGFGDVALRDAINDGDISGPRMLVSGNALGIKGGHCDNNLLPPEYNDVGKGVADGPWAARGKVREMVKYGADLIKICASGGVLTKGDQPGTQQYTLEEMKAIVEEAHKLGRGGARPWRRQYPRGDCGGRRFH